MQLSTIITIRTTENIALPSQKLEKLKEYIYEPLIKLLDNDDPEIVDYEITDVKNYSLSTAKWKATQDPDIETYTYVSVVMENGRFNIENFNQFEQHIILEITKLLRQRKLNLLNVGTEEINLAPQVHLFFEKAY